MITGVWHFSFTVSDLEQSLEFYTGLLGMKLIHRQDQSSEHTRKLVGYPEADLRVALLGFEGASSVPSGYVFELIQYRAPVLPPHPPGTAYPNSAHLAFVAENALNEYERLRGAGVRFRSEPVAITSGINRGGYTVYFRDPDGITLELVQPPQRANS
jgi:catechol 2,3-dioxygenase-like lactoylglutathione lyase family enzyme